jgi:hypothetical protein
MKNWQITGFLAILIIGFLQMSGCISNGSVGAEPGTTPTPQIVDVTYHITPSPTKIPYSTPIQIPTYKPLTPLPTPVQIPTYKPLTPLPTPVQIPTYKPLTPFPIYTPYH